MRSQSQAAQRGASNTPHRLSSGGVSPLSSASITLMSALLILTIPICYSESNIYLLSLLWFCLCCNSILFLFFYFLIVTVFSCFIFSASSWVVLSCLCSQTCVQVLLWTKKKTWSICRMTLKGYCWVSLQTFWLLKHKSVKIEWMFVIMLLDFSSFKQLHICVKLSFLQQPKSTFKLHDCSVLENCDRPYNIPANKHLLQLCQRKSDWYSSVSN